jgi:hypothetical protein
VVLLAEHRLEVEVALAREDLDLVARAIERREERQALHVIPVGVADEDRRLALTLAERLFHQGLAEAPDAGARIDDDRRLAVGPDLDARGVPTVAVRGPPGDWDRTANSPEPDLHRRARDDPNVTESLALEQLARI